MLRGTQAVKTHILYPNQDSLMNMQTSLVTGGSGFLGSHLCQQLLAQEENVICLDNLSTGHLRNIEPLLAHKKFLFINHDVQSDMIDLFKLKKINKIYNLASPASPEQYQKQPITTTLTNVIGTARCLELAQFHGASFLQASTSEVYGEPLIHPQKENYFGNVSTIGPRACYDEGKRCAETITSDYHKKYGIPVKIIRIFNTYGPHMSCDDGRVVSNFVVQALQNKTLKIYGNGLQTRSFCFVDDLVSGLMQAMETKKDCWMPINIGNNNEISILELAQKIIKLTHSQSQIQFLPPLESDPRQRKPDLTRAKSILSWQPKVSLEKGLLKTIEYFRKFI